MTLKELSQLYLLKKEISIDKERIKELRAQAELPTFRRGEQLSKGAPESTVERISAKIIDLERDINIKTERCLDEQKRLENYISSIDDSLTRTIFTLRFVNGYSWVKVAHSTKGNSSESVKKICYRYLHKHKN